MSKYAYPGLSRSSRGLRAVGLVVALTSVLHASVARSAPRSVYNGSTLAHASNTPSAVGGSDLVSAQTGTFVYGFPIETPPGRLGIEPSLALSYRSDGAIYGGLAAGWSLDVPSIGLDTRDGILIDERRWVSGLAGGERLQATGESTGADAEGAFRARYDLSGMRYDRQRAGQPFEWVATPLDGTVYRFGDRSPGRPTEVLALLSEIEDAHGNVLTYQWAWWDVAIAPQLTAKAYALLSIEYTSNPAASLAPFARVDFAYRTQRPCVEGALPAGSQLSARTGVPIIDGYLQLQSVTTSTDDRTTPGGIVRSYELVYDQDAERCDGSVAPRRQLVGIKSTGWSADGTSLDSPPTTFQYNPREPSHTRETWQVRTERENGLLGYRASIFVDHMLVDMDGDGLVDRLSSGGIEESCDFYWQRNTGTGFEEARRWVDRPALPEGKVPDDWALDHSVAPDGETEFPTYLGQRCALNAQYTLITSPTAVDPDDRCRHDGRNYRAGSVVNWRFQDVDHDGLVDMVAGVDLNRIAVDGDDPGFEHEGLLEYDLQQVTNHSFTTEIDSLIATAEAAYEGSVEFGCEAVVPRKVGNWYQWIVYRNEGNGAFTAAPELWGMPAPVVAISRTARVEIGSDQADGPYKEIMVEAGAADLVADPFAFVDIDGDGYEDLVSSFKSAAELAGDVAPSRWWNVMRGRPDGMFEGKGTAEPYRVAAPEFAHANGVTIEDHQIVPGAGFLQFEAVANGLHDLNGDGVPEFAWTESDNYDLAQYASWNVSARSWLGSGRGVTTCDPEDQDCAVVLDGPTTVSNLGVATFAHRQTSSLAFPPFMATIWSNTTLVDVDGDGRQDLVTYGQVRLNGGGFFLPPTSLTDPARFAVAQREYMPSTLLPFAYATTLLVDLDGDGRMDPMVHQYDGLDFDGNSVIDPLGLDVADESGTWAVYRASREPPGLLNRIDNGIGGRTYITYATVRDEWVVEDWNLPAQTWVVSAITSSGGDATPAQETTYDYADAAWLPDEDGRYAFRGFRRVGVNTPTGGRIATLYDHGTFYRGLPVETVVSDSTIAGEPPRSIDQVVWQSRSLHGVPLQVTVQRDARTCAIGQDISSCRVQGALLRTTTTWETVGDTALLPTEVRSAAGTSVTAVGTRIGTTVYQTVTIGSHTRVRGRTTQRQSITSEGIQTAGFSESVYDAELRRLLEVRNRVDDVRVATARFTHDPTGLVLTIERPTSVAAGAGQVSTTSYDAYRAYVRQVVNEAGHVATTVYDLGTGMPVTTKGPQYKCPGWWLPCVEPWLAWRTTELRYDGLGRLVSRQESFDSGANAYVLREVERLTYHEWNGSGPAENKVVTEGRIEAGDPTLWTRNESVSDGLGRVARETASTFDPSVPDAVVIYHRDSRGLVTSVESPDPASSSAERVTAYFEHDGLGRRIRSWHSSGLGGEQYVAYDGLRTEARLEAADGGPAPDVAHLRDVFGRVVRVEEGNSDGVPAVTEYVYDDTDNLKTIVDADGLVTSLGHDLASNRIWIERGGRRWSYSHDLEGRITTATVPHPTGFEADYTSRTTYDVMGRVLTHSPAPGGLAADELTALAFGPLQYTYDQFPESRGAVDAIATPASVEEYRYNASGMVSWQSQQFTATGAPADILAQSASYNALGAVTEVLHPEGNTTYHEYDRRGLPIRVRTPTNNIAEQTRNSAGVVRQRTTKFGAANPASRTSWSCDSLGRILEHRVELRPIGAPWMTFARQTHGYFDSGDVREIVERINSVDRVFAFAYDQQSQILSAQDNLGYHAGYQYTPAGRLLGVDLVLPATADVSGRDVFYDYDVQDLERVRALVDATTGTDSVTLAHDEAGNIVEKRTSSEDVDLRYDGEGRLRIAIRGEQRELYHYDSSGRRVLAVRYTNGSVDRTRRWFGDVQRVDDGGSITTDLTISLGTPVARLRNGQVEYLHHNAAGNLLLAVNAIGVPVAGFSYGAFGEILEQQQQAERFGRRYQDNERDELSGWYDYGHRLYDPEVGIWNRADPLFQLAPDAAGLEPRRAALYTFSLNNPLRYVDPDGRNPVSQFFGAIGRAFEEGARWAGRQLSRGVATFKEIVTVPVRALEGASNATVAHMYANAAPCKFDCAKAPPPPEKVWLYVAAGAAMAALPAARSVRTVLQRGAVGAEAGGATAVAGAGTRAAAAGLAEGSAAGTAARAASLPAAAPSTAAGGAITTSDIAALGGQFAEASQLTQASASRIYLGHFGGEGIIVGGQRVAAPNPGLQVLERLAGQHGGRTLAGMPGEIDALANAIRTADEIVFNVGASGIRANSLTAKEFDLIVREGMFDKVRFVTGLTY